MFLWRCKKLAKCPKWSISLLNRIFRGAHALPLFAPFTPIDAVQRLIGLLETAVNQVPGGFLKVLGSVNQSPIQCQTLLDFYRISMETF